jgi:hypothetical protein
MLTEVAALLPADQQQGVVGEALSSVSDDVSDDLAQLHAETLAAIARVAPYLPADAVLAVARGIDQPRVVPWMRDLRSSF